MAKIFVTGGTGIVGIRLLYDLLKEQEDVLALKRSSSDTFYVRKAFEFYDPHSGKDLFSKIKWIDGDIVDGVAMNEILNGMDEVYHCAALVSFKQRHREEMQNINTMGTTHIVNACLENGIKKLCYISSVAALERNTDKEFINESNTGIADKNRSNYGQSKYLAEVEVWRGIEEGLNAVIVNPSLILGAGRPNMSSGLLYKTVMNGLKYYGSGSNGVIDVRTISEVCKRLMRNEIFGERFILSAHNISHKDLFTLIARALGKTPPSNKVSPLILKAGSIVASFMSSIGLEPIIGKESLESASTQMKYDNSKISNFLDVQYLPVEESVAYFAEYYKSIAP